MSNQQLVYDLENDGQIYLKTNLEFANHNLSVEACTIAGTKDGITPRKNEDAFSLTVVKNKFLACVFDGNSSLKPIKDLGELSGARYASHYLSSLFAKIASKSNDEKDLMIKMNAKLLESVMKFTGTDINDTHTLPATSATIVSTDFPQNKLFFVHIGDTFCIVFYKDGSSQMITNDKIKPFDEVAFKIIKELTSKKNITPKEAGKDESIREMLKKRYTEYDNRTDGTGYGELNGQENAISYIQSGTLKLDLVDSIIMGTDGVIPQGWNTDYKSDRNHFLYMVKNGGLKALIKEKKSLENSDPNFQKFIRYKHSDDATAVFLQLS